MWLISILTVDAIAVACWIGVLTALDAREIGKPRVRLAVRFFLYGLISYPVVAFLYLLSTPFEWLLSDIGGRFGLFLYRILINGPIEELAKAGVFVFFVTRRKAILEVRDGVLLAVSVGLGYAAAENFHYGLSGGSELVAYRSLLATVGHVEYAFLWGIAFASAVCMYGWDERRKLGEALVLSIILASFLHGLFNFLLDLKWHGIAVLMDVMLATACFGLAAAVTHYSPLRHYSFRESKQAVQAIRMALTAHPNHTQLSKKMAIHQIALGDLDGAYQTLSSARWALWKDPWWELLNAVCLWFLGQTVEGEKLLRRALFRMPEETRERAVHMVRRALARRHDTGEFLSRLNTHAAVAALDETPARFAAK
jgi:RsiW-degrading membrane proteinase PrsW (M82 family)